MESEFKLEIAVFGDSITHGGKDTEYGGWVTRLRLYCMGKGLGDHVFALGIGGDSSRGLRKRFDVELSARMDQVTKVMLAVGVNDIFSQRFSCPEEEFQRNMTALAEQGARAGKQVIILGLYHYVAARMTHYKPEMGEDYLRRQAFLQQLCAREGYIFLNPQEVLGPDDIADALHPNPQGHRKLFEWVRDRFRDLGFLPPD